MFLFKTLFIAVAIQLLSITSNAQTFNLTRNYTIELGTGSSAYNNFNSEQFLFFMNLPGMNSHYKNISWDTKINLELINDLKSDTYLIGIVPFIRYDTSLLNLNLFVKGGIGTNYINNHNIGPRKTGSHFIFSDMIAIGTKLFQTKDYALELSYLFRHVSNAGIYKRNQGYNSQYLVISFII